MIKVAIIGFVEQPFTESLIEKIIEKQSIVEESKLDEIKLMSIEGKLPTLEDNIIENETEKQFFDCDNNKHHKKTWKKSFYYDR